MRRIALFSLTLTVFLGMNRAALLPDQEPSAQPGIRCLESRYDFGRVLQGRPVEHVFVVENAGGALLTIESVRPECNCTTAPISSNFIEPGKNAEIRVIFDTAKFEGPVEKSVTVHSDDARQPDLQLVLTGNVFRPYVVVPAEIDIQRVSKNAEYQTAVTLIAAETQAPKILSVAVEAEPFFAADLAPRPAPGEYTATLRLLPGASPHPVEGFLVFRLDDPDRCSVRVPIHGEITTDVTVYPEQLVFGRIWPGNALLRRILVTIANPRVTVDSVSVEPPSLEVALTTRQPLPEHAPGARTVFRPVAAGVDIQIRAKADAPPGDVRGALTIHTSSPDQPVIVVPLTGTIAPARPKPK